MATVICYQVMFGDPKEAVALQMVSLAFGNAASFCTPYWSVNVSHNFGQGGILYLARCRRRGESVVLLGYAVLPVVFVTKS